MCTVLTNQQTKPPKHNPPKRHQPPTRNLPKRNQQSARNLPKRNRRGGACVPVRTSAQRRFHTKNMRIVCGEFNDECALAGRHGRVAAFPYQKYAHCVRGITDGCALVGRRGRAHRHRPYQSPLYIRVQSSPTTSTTQTKRVNNPHTHRGRECIAHSRPHS